MTAIAPLPSYTSQMMFGISPPGSPLDSPPGSPSSNTPPDSPPFYSADDATEIHSDDLPPAFSSIGTTPAPSDDHSDMVSHHSEIVVVDEESFHNIHHRPTSPATTGLGSRPVSPVPPRTTATPLVVHNRSPLSNSFTASEAMVASPVESRNSRPRRSVENHRSLAVANSTVTSIFTAPPPPAHTQSRHDHHTIPSPFSFFAHNSHSHGDHPAPQPHIKTLRIELAPKDIVLTTGKTAVLEGTLYLTLHKTTKIKTLHLEFMGRSSVTWVDDANAYSPATRYQSAPHIEHTWAMIPHQHKQPATVLQAGQHAFPFTLDLPDNLPETMTTTHGKCAYRLTATLTKPGITFSTTNATTPVTLLRRFTTDGPLSRTYQRGGRLVNEPNDKVKYKIALPQVRVPHSMKVPLQVVITSPNDQISVQVLQVGLWERVVYRAEDRQRADIRLVKIQKSGGWPHVSADGNPTTESVTWNKVLLFEMPSMGHASSECNPSGDNGLMKVTHHLRFTILGSEGTKRFRLENELEVKVLAFEDEAPMLVFEEGRIDENGESLSELPSYLTSFSTPRVSFDAERDGIVVSTGEEEDDVLRALVAQIHLPTYAESEEDTHSRDGSRNGSRTASPERCSFSHARSNSNSSSGSSASSQSSRN